MQREKTEHEKDERASDFSRVSLSLSALRNSLRLCRVLDLTVYNLHSLITQFTGGTEIMKSGTAVLVIIVQS